VVKCVITNASLSFVKESGNKITIDRDNRLFINGNEKALDNRQQQLIDDYADGVRDLVPEVIAIVIEGVNLGVEAATLALGMLLGENDPDIVQFSMKLNELADTITMKLDANNFNSKSLEETFDKEFEGRVEAIVEEAITELTPRLVAKALTAAMSGDEGEMSDLEQRAEYLEGEIENYVEPRAEALEARAEKLCQSVDTLDALEGKMVDSGLDMMDLIDKGQGGHKYRFKDKPFDFNLGD